MELIDKILLVLKNAKKPLKAKQITYNINLKYKTDVTRKSINSLLYYEMKDIVEEHDFKWRLKTIADNNSTNITIDKKEINKLSKPSYPSKKMELILKEFIKKRKEYNRIIKLLNESDRDTTYNQVQKSKSEVKDHKKIISDFLKSNYDLIDSKILFQIEKEIPELLNSYKVNSQSIKIESSKTNAPSDKRKKKDIKNMFSSNLDLYIKAFKKGRAKKGFDEIHDRFIKFLISKSTNIHDFINYVLTTNLLYYRTNRHKVILHVLEDRQIQYYIITKYLSYDDKKININETDEITSCIKEMNYSYYMYKFFMKYGNMYDYIANKFNNKYNKLFEKCIKIITTKNLPLYKLKNTINEYSFSKIERSELTTEWIVEKIENNETDDDTKSERKEEYRILCDQFWSDGIITNEEENHLIELRKKLNLNEQEANSIFKKSNTNYLDCRKNWKINFKKEMDSSVQINYDKKIITLNTSMKKKEEMMSEFIRKVFSFRNKHRSLELDLFFENLEEFYDNE